MTRRSFCAIAHTVAALPLADLGSREPAGQAKPSITDPQKVVVPPPRREFRGVWIASVDNIDWPSRRDLTTDEQKAELLTLLDRSLQLNLNAVLLQVRPVCDALYASPIEPWSAYLTGMMGKAPAPFYDPLEFAVAEAHKRGLELHAWCNPFRVRQAGAGSSTPVAANHVSQTHPDWVRQYGKMLWLDPGEAAARDYSLAVFADIVRRYDVDGIHIDDYFYPYKIEDSNHNEVDFPDDPTFGRYVAGGGTLSLSAWRRANIDDFVRRMYEGAKAVKPWVKVGISPFGIWRPRNPAQIKGLDSFEELYGDSRHWLQEGWADYFSPQLYWRIEQTSQSFPVLLAWWLGENVKGRHIWPGLDTGLASGEHPRWPQAEIEYQIKTTRGLAGSKAGQVHFSGRFLRDGSIADTGTLPRHLSETVYAESVPVPESPWLENLGGSVDVGRTPAAPVGLTVTAGADSEGSGWTAKWNPGDGPLPWQWLIQWRVGGATVWHQSVLASDSRKIFIPVTGQPGPTGTDAAKIVVAVTGINRIGAASAPAITSLPAPPPTPAPS